MKILFRLKNIAIINARGVGYRCCMFDMTDKDVHNILGYSVSEIQCILQNVAVLKANISEGIDLNKTSGSKNVCFVIIVF